MMSAATSEEIVDKKAKVSAPVWQFFGFLSDYSQTNVVSKLCKTVVPPKTGHTTNCFSTLAALTLWSTAVSDSND